MKKITINLGDGEHRYIGNKLESGIYKLSFQELMPSIGVWRTLDTHLYDESYYQYLLRKDVRKEL